MNVFTKGTPARLADVPNGECFAFDIGNQIAFGIKIAYPQSQDSRVLVLTRGGGQPPSLLGRQEAPPRIVYKLPAMAVVTGTAPNQLRDGVGNPRPGNVMVIGDEVFVGFLDEHNDPSSASLKTGLIDPNPLNGAAAVFETWKIEFHGGGEPEPVFAYNPTPARAA